MSQNISVGKLHVNRLLLYRRAVYKLKTLGFVRLFSENLSDATGVSATQVRKDLSIFGVSGIRKAGYRIDELLSRFDEILGKNKVYKIIIVGIGRLGDALLNYRGFENEGMEIVGAFDIAKSRHSTQGRIPIMPLERLPSFIQEEKVKIGIIAVPESSAQEVCDLMVQSGVRGILNFAPVRVSVPDTCVIKHVNLALELEELIYFVHAIEKHK